MSNKHTYHLAEFNFGVLRHDWDDPRVAGFVNALDRVNAVAKRSPGFVWMLSEDAMETEQNTPDGALGGNPLIASTLSVWEDVASLDAFVFNTVHRQFYQRRAEWFDAVTGGNLVMWWVPVGHRPSVAEGMARWQHREANGDSDHAFGWAVLKDAQFWQSRNCTPVAAE
ncbi:MAG: DUF3291 domain-containing protein [Albidovulum sp.]